MRLSDASLLAEPIGIFRIDFGFCSLRFSAVAAILFTIRPGGVCPGFLAHGTFHVFQKPWMRRTSAVGLRHCLHGIQPLSFGLPASWSLAVATTICTNRSCGASFGSFEAGLLNLGAISCSYGPNRFNLRVDSHRFSLQPITHILYTPRTLAVGPQF